MPKVSVIVPIYNVEEYLSKCLDSVINQTLKDIEIICVDDIGKDNSMQIVSEYAKKDDRIKIVKHDVNKGLGEARNTGLDNAVGETIFFLDSDDAINLDILEKLYNKMLEDKVDVVISTTHTYGENSDSKYVKERVIGITEYLKFEPFSNYQVDMDNFSKAISEISCVAWGRLYVRDFIEKNDLRFARQNLIHEDNGFFLKLCSCFPKVSAIKDVGVLYLIRTSSITGEIEKKENIKKKKAHLEAVVKDALAFIKNKHNKETFSKIAEILKPRRDYCHGFNRSYMKILKVKYAHNTKRIELFGITIYKKFIDTHHKKIIYKVLGIKVRKVKYD